ncbi:hypothetical protein GE09DRAFT_59905 [Coniochaeta sp. 2T2.1]|nr:hypothetical protein GE09DRAFT_59905 [Coniochaeta sp. 2T2.1]
MSSQIVVFGLFVCPFFHTTFRHTYIHPKVIPACKTLFVFFPPPLFVNKDGHPSQARVFSPSSSLRSLENAQSKKEDKTPNAVPCNRLSRPSSSPVLRRSHQHEADPDAQRSRRTGQRHIAALPSPDPIRTSPQLNQSQPPPASELITSRRHGKTADPKIFPKSKTPYSDK